jgi:hypothetical protein
MKSISVEDIKKIHGNVHEMVQAHLKLQNLYDTLQAKCERYKKALKEISGHAGQLIPPKHEMIAIANEALAGDGEKEVENG